MNPPPPPPFPLYLKKRRKRRAQTCSVHGTILLLHLGTRKNYLTANNNNNNNNDSDANELHVSYYEVQYGS